jgi:hypothetical protein
MPYGRSEAYELGAQWLAPCSLVEDWGCGLGWMRNLIPAGRYRGIDGTASMFCDEVVDLVTYRSTVEGIFMRAVLEHNYDWDIILANALASFTKRMVLAMFTPTDGPTREIAFVEEIGVPDLAISLKDLTSAIQAAKVTFYGYKTFPTELGYGEETIFYLEREDSCASQ